MGKLNLTQALSKTAKLIKDSIGANLNNTVWTTGLASNCTSYTVAISGITITDTNEIMIAVKFHATCGGSPYIKVNSLNSLPMVYRGSLLGVGQIKAGDTLLLKYYYECWNIIGTLPSLADYSTDVTCIGKFAGSNLYRQCFYGQMTTQEKVLSIPSFNYPARCDIFLKESGNDRVIAIPLEPVLADGKACIGQNELWFRAPSSEFYGSSGFYYNVVIEYAG